MMYGGVSVRVFIHLGDRSSELGEVHIKASRLQMDGGIIGTDREISRLTEARAGNVIIDVDRLHLTGQALIDASTVGGERAGDLKIMANWVILEGGSQISSESTDRGNAGTIRITAEEMILRANSKVTTTAMQANGGDIRIESQVLRLEDSAITADVGGGTGGNLILTPEGIVVLIRSDITTRAGAGEGGNIRIGGLVADTDSTVDASSDLGIDGEVAVGTAVNLGSITPLPQSFAQDTTLFDDPCAQRVRRGRGSNFVVVGRDSVPADPSGGLPSPIIEASQRGGKTGRTWRASDGQAVVSQGAVRHHASAGSWRQTVHAYDCSKERSKTTATVPQAR